MKAVSGYSEAKATNFNTPERLPVGGYVLKVLDVKEENYGWGDVVVLRFDITEGEQKGFFDKQYKAMSDEYKKWKGTYRLNVPNPKGNSEDDVKKYMRSVGFFRSQIEAFEKSNNIIIDCSKEWDTSVLKNKVVGAVFGNKEWEYDGKTGWYTSCDHLIEAADIRSGNFKIPKDKPLDKNSGSVETSVINTDNFEIIDDSEKPVPF